MKTATEITPYVYKRFNKVMNNQGIDDYTLVITKHYDGREDIYDINPNKKEVTLYEFDDDRNYIDKVNAKIDSKDISVKKAVKKVFNDLFHLIADDIITMEREFDPDEPYGFSVNQQENTPAIPTTPFEIDFITNPNYQNDGLIENVNEEEYLEDETEDNFETNINHDDANFKNDIDNNCFIPLDPDYSSYREFLSDIKPLLAEKLGVVEDDILITERREENGESFYDFSLNPMDESLEAPKLPLNEFYRLYRTSELDEDEVLEIVRDRIVLTYMPMLEDQRRAEAEKLPFDIANFDEVKHKIYPKLINTDLSLLGNDNIVKTGMNEEKKFAFIIITDGEAKDMSTVSGVMVTKEMLDVWNKNLNDILEMCEENLLSQDSYNFKTLKDTIKEEADILNIPKELMPQIEYPDVYVCKNPGILIFIPDIIDDMFHAVKDREISYIITSDNEFMFSDSENKAYLETLENDAFKVTTIDTGKDVWREFIKD